MPQSTSNPANACTVGVYAGGIIRAATWLLVGVPQHKRDDIAQTIAETFLRDADRIMQHYPSGEAYAAASWRHRTIDYESVQRTQRGAGARTITETDGRVRERREVISLDAALETRSTVGAAMIGHEDAVVGQMLAAALIRALPLTEQALIVMVHAHSYTVTEAAHRIGQSRSHVSRRLITALRSVKQSPPDT